MPSDFDKLRKSAPVLPSPPAPEAGLDLSPAKPVAKHADDSLVIFQLRVKESLRRDIKSKAAALDNSSSEFLEILFKTYESRN